MKLRTKLFLGVGILLFAMGLLMYILPISFIRKDVYAATDSIRTLLIKNNQQLQHSQQIWLKDVLTYVKQNNDALLFMLYEDNKFKAQMGLFNNGEDAAVWESLARIVGYDPSIGIVQAYVPGVNKTAVLTPGSARLYPIEKLSHEKGLILLSTSLEDDQNTSRHFVGIPLPNGLQSDKGYTLYALVSPEKAIEDIELQEVYEEIAHLTPELVKKKLSNADQIASALDENNDAFRWSVKVGMIRELTPFYVEGLALGKKGGLLVPEGLARIDTKGEGHVILTQEIYSTERLFDDVSFYAQHMPKEGKSPLSTGTVLLTVPQDNSAYVGNTLMLGKMYLTLAVPVNILAVQLALASNKMVLLQVNQSLWLGYNEHGSKLSQKDIYQILAVTALSKKNDTITAAQHEFYFAKISSLEEGNLVLYDIHSLSDEKSIFNTLLALQNKLSKRISTQLLLIALGTMILVLLFIGRIGLTIISPITKLARATQFVAEGRYAEVALPDMGKRKDEVAILTHSFANMVTGLQEREKIRAVLDKVVSKDVAEEILRTQIHLGGEDRMVTMLFGDIRGFTEFTAHMPPQKTIQMLNECMTKVSRVIEGEGGVIDKYVGDEVMAIFGAPATTSDHALRAVSSGMLIIETLKKWNLERAAASEPLVEMGIGIHTGIVMAGNMGAEDRLNYTVVGAHVNLAARLCDVAKANQLIVSAATLAEPRIEASFHAQSLPAITLKGFASPVVIYEITGFKWDDS